MANQINIDTCYIYELRELFVMYREPLQIGINRYCSAGAGLSLR